MRHRFEMPAISSLVRRVQANSSRLRSNIRHVRQITTRSLLRKWHFLFLFLSRFYDHVHAYIHVHLDIGTKVHTKQKINKKKVRPGKARSSEI